MHRIIVVPLDGSPFAERAIPLALRIARHTGASVDLAHVHEPVVYGGGAPVVDPRLDTEIKQGMHASLETLRDRVAKRASVPVTSTFIEGKIVPALQAHVESRGAGLVVMTTHGRGGLSRAWLGSVADALVRHLHVPVLLARQRSLGGGGADAPPVRRVLVPLDGSPRAEAVLEHALSLGSPSDTEYLLLRVVVPTEPVPIPYRGAPGSDAPPYRTELELREQEAQQYVASVAERVSRSAMSVHGRVVVHAYPARAILDIAREFDADLIALSAHGHHALGRLLLGSVADKVIRGATVPTLVYRPATIDAAGLGADSPRAADTLAAQCTQTRAAAYLDR